LRLLLKNLHMLRKKEKAFCKTVPWNLGGTDCNEWLLPCILISAFKKVNLLPVLFWIWILIETSGGTKMKKVFRITERYASKGGRKMNEGQKTADFTILSKHLRCSLLVPFWAAGRGSFGSSHLIDFARKTAARKTNWLNIKALCQSYYIDCGRISLCATRGLEALWPETSARTCSIRSGMARMLTTNFIQTRGVRRVRLSLQKESASIPPRNSRRASFCHHQLRS